MQARAPVVSVVVPDYVVVLLGPPPPPGRTVEYSVAFEPSQEATDALSRSYLFVAEPDATPLAPEVTVGGDVAATATSTSCIGVAPAPDPAWPVLLDAGSWAADWLAPRRAQGPVRLTGRLRAEPPGAVHPAARVRGRVSRLQLIRESWRYDAATRGWSTDDRRRVLHEVSVCPPLLDSGPPASGPGRERSDGSWSRHVAVLVDVVPEPRVRPSG